MDGSPPCLMSREKGKNGNNGNNPTCVLTNSEMLP